METEQEQRLVQEACEVVALMVDASLTGKCENARQIMVTAIDAHANGEMLGNEILHRLVCGLANATAENAAIRHLAGRDN